MSLYALLMFIHLAGVFAFLFAHGVSGGASFLLRGPVSGSTRVLLQVSQRSAFISNPALLLIIVTGVWMTFAGHWAHMIWPWAAVVVLLVILGLMFYVARPYYVAREAIGGSDDAISTALSRTRPILAAWVGIAGLVVLLALMVFKPF